MVNFFFFSPQESPTNGFWLYTIFMSTTSVTDHNKFAHFIHTHKNEQIASD